MRCPFCGNDDSQVKDSRPTEDSAAIRRRRQCEGCGARFTTFERIQLRDLYVLKKDGVRQAGLVILNVPFALVRFSVSVPAPRSRVTRLLLS